METGIIRGFIQPPRRQNQQCPACAGLETAALRLPIALNGLFLQVDDGQSLVDGCMNHKAFSLRYAWRYKNNAFAGFVKLAVTRSLVAFGLFGRKACSLVATMIEHLFLLGTLQQEESAEGSIFVGTYAQMQAALHQVGQLSPHQGTERVVGHIALDILQHTRALDNAVVIAVLKEGRARRLGRYRDRS